MHAHICTLSFEGFYHISYIFYIILNYVLLGHYHYKIRNRMMETEDTGGSEV